MSEGPVSRRQPIALRCMLLAGFLASSGPVVLAQGFGAPSTSPMPANTAPAGSPNTPLTQMSPVPPRSTYASPNPPSVSLGNPMFDPYKSGNNPGVFTPALPNQPIVPPSATVPGGAALGSMFGGTPSSPAGFPGSPPPYGAPPPTYPPSAYPNPGPPVLFPGGLLGGGMGSTPGNYYNPAGEFGFPAALKFCQGPRIQHAYIGGGGGDQSLAINETDVSVAFAFPNFLYSGQPIYILPSFSLDLWDGPTGGTADLPGSAYGAYIDAGWQTDPNQILGLETGLRVGVFTDFDTLNSDSLRTMGQVLGKFRLSPRATLKAGVMYVDRNEVKLIPAGGILWQPNPYSRWDLYFPEPKVSHYIQTLGTQDLWGYIAGEYGGGSWTITRASGDEESIDINDLRVLAGVEWGRSDLIRSGRRTGFIEAGVVFNREVIYTKNPQDNFEPDPSFIVRLGIGY